MNVQPLAQVRVLLECYAIAVIGQSKNMRQGDIIECESRCAWNATGHVGDAIVDHLVNHIGGVGMGGRF